MDRRQEDLLRDAAPQVLTVLVRRYGHFDACEDAVQEALLAATAQWGRDGEPESPRSWLLTVASRRLIDQLRSESARRRREDGVAALEPDERHVAPPADEAVAVHDDTLTLLFLCCHPALTPGSQLALTLRAVGGLTTAEIAAALLVPETTLAQRISRAKQRIRDAGARFVAPAARERDDRLTVVLQVLYLIFNEGYTARSGERLHRPELTAEAIRITRLVHDLVPDDGEVAGLLALMLTICSVLVSTPTASRPHRAGPPVGHDRRQVDWSPGARHASVPIRCRPPSRRCTASRRRPMRPTGPRSWRCTTCSPRWRPTRWSP